jgi:prepilin-type N-terminal cleavage/methylation domain-containing protein
MIRSRGYTLMEMLIVLAVLAALAAMSWPALRGSLEKSRLQNAAKQLGTEIVRARLRAIEMGRPYQLRFEPGGNRLEVGPCPTFAEPTAATINNPEQEERPTEIELPEGVTFMASDPAAAAPEPEPESAADQWSAGEWSVPIVFQPSGRSSNARFRLSAGQNYSLEVTLRGLTGNATIGPLQRLEVSQ